MSLKSKLNAHLEYVQVLNEIQCINWSSVDSQIYNLSSPHQKRFIFALIYHYFRLLDSYSKNLNSSTEWPEGRFNIGNINDWMLLPQCRVRDFSENGASTPRGGANPLFIFNNTHLFWNWCNILACMICHCCRRVYKTELLFMHILLFHTIGLELG